MNYLYDQISALGGYYDVEFQPFVELYTAGSASIKANGEDQGAALFTYSPSGKFSKPLVNVANLGCDAVNQICKSSTAYTELTKHSQITRQGSREMSP